MAEVTKPLLSNKVVYFDNCPGCKVDQEKAANPGIPYKSFFYIWVVTICAALPISSVFPFLYFLIRDLHVAKRVEDIGFYAGFVGSSLVFGRALSALFWGMVADRYGRKPVLIIGILSVVVFNTVFGLTTTYWMAIVTRLLLGILNGILITIKAYAAEMARPEHQALALSNVSTAWGIGLIIGPAIGGFFAQPADKYPSIFSKDSFFGRFPYFLPCLCISILALFASLVTFWLPETLHFHDVSKTKDEITEAPQTSYASDLKKDEEPKENLLKNWSLMSSVLIYCIFSLQDMAYTETFSLWAVSDRKFGGLSFMSQQVGVVLAISGFGLLISQVILYPSIERFLGHLNSCRLAAILTIPLLVTYPFMTKLSGIQLALAINLASYLKSLFNMITMTAIFVWQNNAVSQRQRGAANGISMTLQSLFRAIAPASAGIIFSWAQKRQRASILPGDHLIFFFINVVGVVGFILTFRPFLRIPK